MNKKEKLEVEEGSTNVFADLGFENPEEELFKADLTAEIARAIRVKNLTQAQAAKILNVDQPRISRLLSGRTDLFSIETLMHFLVALGQDVEVSVKPKPSRRKRAHWSVVGSSRYAVPIPAKSTSKSHD